VAVGGRTTLLGPVLGAVAVAWAQTSLSERFPSAWTYLYGLLFIVAVGFFPGGLASIGGLVRRRRGSTPEEPAPSAGAPADTRLEVAR